MIELAVPTDTAVREAPVAKDRIIPRPADETARLAALREYELLDTAADEDFDRMRGKPRRLRRGQERGRHRRPLLRINVVFAVVGCIAGSLQVGHHRSSRQNMRVTTRLRPTVFA